MSFLDKNKAEKITNFVKYTIKELKINKNPSIHILNGRNKLKTTAAYDYGSDEKIVKINGKNRAVVDIMRSIAHELVHHKQFEDGRLEKKPPDIGGTIEDAANAIAGQLIKKYSKIDNSIYDDI